MNVTYVALQPAVAARAAGTPCLTPELLAATGARYSRNNEGLGAILARIDPADPDRSVDAIFRMVDYGHQSIADMAPVAMFLDGLTMILGYTIWSLCPTAGGQESSTRYIDLSPSGVAAPAALGIPDPQAPAWREGIAAAFQAYGEALALWQELGAAHPELTRIPEALRHDPSDAARRKVARLERNYAFDRARYFLPAAASTNVMLVMSARGWVQLCRHLCSHPWPEAVRLGGLIREQLRLATPRLIKHAAAADTTQAGIRAEFAAWSARARAAGRDALSTPGADPAADPAASLQVLEPPGGHARELADDLRFHDNRYAWTGESLRRMAVRFGWGAVAMAEIRDLNRHRTGSKHCPLCPCGFYSAADQLPAGGPESARLATRLAALRETGRTLTLAARARLAAGDPSFAYWTLLGTQFPFEHLTTADKFIYEAELRTGLGAHYRYARHLRDALALWYERYPQTRGLILEGAAEPE